MKPQEESLLLNLLTERKTASVAVLVNGEPYVGLMPFAVLADHTGALVHVSTLAKHTKGMGDGQPFSLLIQAPETPGLDPLQTPRVTLQGQVEAIPKSQEGQPNPEYLQAQAIYLAKFPQSGQLFQMGDFSLYLLRFESGRFVAGFAAAYNLNPSTLKNLRS